MLCPACKQIFTTQAQPSQLYPHHKTAAELAASSQNKCQLCTLIERDAKALYTADKQPRNHSYNSGYTLELFPLSWKFDLDGDEHNVGSLGFYGASAKRSITHFDIVPAGDLTANEGLVPSQTDVPTNWSLIAQWLEHCLQNHPRCQKRQGFRPTRLLDLGAGLHGDSVKVTSAEYRGQLSLPHPFPLKYTTLSHCWGSATFLKLLTSNITNLQNEISISSLPKTFQDAIRITRKLGVRYLWIDSLCIIQDSKGDWNSEAAVMHRVYQGSWLNISAAGADDSSGGCFFERDTADVTRTFVEPSWQQFPPGKHVVYPSRWFLDLDRSKLNHRAWVLQERLLSTRVIHFCRKQLMWECMEQMACELLPENVAWGGTGEPLYYHLKAMLKIESTEQFMDDWLPMWHELLRTYTAASITMPSDRLPALAGVVANILDSTPKPEYDYLAGMWRSDLPRSLLWYVVEHRQGNGKPSFRPATYRAPSWSWASVEGEITSMELLNEVTATDLASLVDVEIVGGDRIGVQPFKRGKITIWAPFGRATWEESGPDTAAGGFPRLASVCDADGTAWPCTASDTAVYNTIYFDVLDPGCIPAELFCAAIAGEPLSPGSTEMLLVNGLLLVRVCGRGLPGGRAEQYQRVGTFTLGSVYQLEYSPGYRNPTFMPLRTAEIEIL